MTMKEYDPLSLQNLRIHGRTLDQSPLHLYWTGSGVEMDLRGSELWMNVEADYEDLEPWICVLLNGNLVFRAPMERGTRWIPLFRGLDPAQPHNIKILRESQAMPTDPKTCVRLHSLRMDGELAELSAPTCRLEFIGDSLSSAEGSLGSPIDTEWRPIWFSASSNYGRLTAELLGGESRHITQSGWGVLSSYANDPACNVPAYYEQVCGVVPEGYKGSCKQPNDFTAWKPDVVVCALGSNDRGAMANAAFTDPLTGKSFKQTQDDTKPLEDAMVAFLNKLRACNPDSYLIWMFFEGEAIIRPVVLRAMNRYKAAGDKRSEVFLVPAMKPTGVRNHPGIDEHWTTAKTLAARIAQLQGLSIV